MSHDSHGPAFLQHHFDTPEQQFNAGKLGMWLFLAQEVLFFGGLFCFYAVYRFNHPEVFHHGNRYLDWKLGCLNTVVLLVSSLTMALAVRAAQLSQRRALLGYLGLTFLCATGFMVVKYVEWGHKYETGVHFGRAFKYELFAEAEEEEGRVPESALNTPAGQVTIEDRAPAATGEAVRSQIYLAPQTQGTLAVMAPEAEHGGAAHADDRGHGPGFILPEEMAELRRLKRQRLAQERGIEPTAVPDSELTISASELRHYQLPGPASGRSLDSERPRNLHQFFSIYYCLTGLHGIHVLGGMIMIIWLMWGAAKGRYNKEWFTPVDLGGLYWHLVDLVWIFLFPLLYLIS